MMAESMTDLLALRFGRELEQLFKEEGLDDPRALVATRSWEEYPTFSRIHRIEFLDSLELLERSFVLFAHSLAHLDRIVELACKSLEPAARSDFVALVTVRGWDDLDPPDPTPPTPCFFICTQSSTLLGRGASVLGAESRQARIVAGWLERLGQTSQWDIAEPMPRGNPDAFAIEVGHRVLPCAGLLTLRDIAARNAEHRSRH
jgi:hypothetical protein